jgi:hypothetical protein
LLGGEGEGLDAAIADAQTWIRTSLWRLTKIVISTRAPSASSISHSSPAMPGTGEGRRIEEARREAEKVKAANDAQALVARSR